MSLLPSPLLSRALSNDFRRSDPLKELRRFPPRNSAPPFSVYILIFTDDFLKKTREEYLQRGVVKGVRYLFWCTTEGEDACLPYAVVGPQWPYR